MLKVKDCCYYRAALLSLNEEWLPTWLGGSRWLFWVAYTLTALSMYSIYTNTLHWAATSFNTPASIHETLWLTWRLTSDFELGHGCFLWRFSSTHTCKGNLSVRELTERGASLRRRQTAVLQTGGVGRLRPALAMGRFTGGCWGFVDECVISVTARICRAVRTCQNWVKNFKQYCFFSFFF